MKSSPPKERRILKDIRAMVENVQAGKDAVPLRMTLIQLCCTVEKAIDQCRSLTAQHPERKAFFAANIEAYNLALDAIEQMDLALEEKDHQALERGNKSLDAAVGTVDCLVQKEQDELDL